MKIRKSIKISLWVVLSIALLFAIVAALASPIAKHVINKRGEDLLGRQLHAEQVKINLYNGDISISNFHCKEADGEKSSITPL